MSESLASVFTDIADSIRSKTGETALMKPAQMPGNINNIPQVTANAYDYIAAWNNNGEMEAASDIHFNYGMMNSRFNEHITIGNNVTNCASLLSYGRYSYNQPTVIPDSVINCYSMFSQCTMLNATVTIGNSVEDCSYMFNGCNNFNQSVTIPESATNCANMFNNCRKFNKSVTIPESVTNCANMFRNCINFERNIYINQTETLNVQGMLNNVSGANVYCNNIAILNKTTAATSLVGAAISWTATDNGYYNSSRDIYIYNNYPVEV